MVSCKDYKLWANKMFGLGKKLNEKARDQMVYQDGITRNYCIQRTQRVNAYTLFSMQDWLKSFPYLHIHRETVHEQWYYYDKKKAAVFLLDYENNKRMI